MKIRLSSDLKIREVKKEFQKEFPYLKIEFFRKKHFLNKASSANDIVPGSARLIEVTGVLREGEIEFGPMNSVAEIERLFQSKYCLPVQIFRKGKYVWIETTSTDHYTLGKQNRMGRHSCNAVYDEVVLL